jgi:hypothetical protein
MGLRRGGEEGRSTTQQTCGDNGITPLLMALTQVHKLFLEFGPNLLSKQWGGAWKGGGDIIVFRNGAFKEPFSARNTFLLS